MPSMNRRRFLASSSLLLPAVALGKPKPEYDLATACWDISKLLGNGALEHIGGAILEQQLSDMGFADSPSVMLAEGLKGAVKALKRHIDMKFEEDNLEDAVADMKNAVDQLHYFTLSRSPDRLINATDLAGSASAHLLKVGLPAFASYHIAVGVQLNIQEERIKHFGESEKKSSVAMIEKGLRVLDKWEEEWKENIKIGIKMLHYIDGFPNRDSPERWMVYGNGYEGKADGETISVDEKQVKKIESWSITALRERRVKEYVQSVKEKAEQCKKDIIKRELTFLDKGHLKEARKTTRRWQTLRKQYA